MTGRVPPSKRELEENLEKRLYLPASGPGSRKPHKRYNRHGVEAHEAQGGPNKLKAGKKGKGKGAAAGAAAGAAGAAGAAAAAGAADPAAAAAEDTGPGFSATDLAAAVAGGLTIANDPTGDNSLGLDIE